MHSRSTTAATIKSTTASVVVRLTLNLINNKIYNLFFFSINLWLILNYKPYMNMELFLWHPDGIIEIDYRRDYSRTGYRTHHGWIFCSTGVQYVILKLLITVGIIAVVKEKVRNILWILKNVFSLTVSQNANRYRWPIWERFSNQIKLIQKILKIIFFRWILYFKWFTCKKKKINVLFNHMSISTGFDLGRITITNNERQMTRCETVTILFVVVVWLCFK